VDGDAGRIEEMFGRIVPRYDLMNRLMTLGLDGRWRAMAAAQAQPAAGGSVLDACCGTGDLAFALAGMYPDSAVIGLDVSETMLVEARRKAAARPLSPPARSLEFVEGDLLDLPFADGAFAAVTVGWGVRNVADIGRAFGEMARVTRPGGIVVCLELTPALPGLSRWAHALWLGRVVPGLGRVVAGDAEAYAYLPASVAAFPPAAELAGVMSAAGLTGIRYRLMGFGGVALHVGRVPGSPGPRP
jgi:demethylmenaquinone methyltransferase / 2-methoxy-6-polyprenyl-1,4-benzoquinol methylase